MMESLIFSFTEPYLGYLKSPVLSYLVGYYVKILYKNYEFPIRLAKRVCDIEGEIAPRHFEIWTEGIKSKSI